MARTIRLANKTQWALQDIVSASQDARREWDKAMKMARGNHDPAMMYILGHLRDYIGKVEIKAKDALHGEYEQELGNNDATN